jgi:hypothetical protein
MAETRRRLFQNGLPEENFATIIAEEQTSRAEELYNEANGFRAGTILAGRRGMTSVKAFSMGRVSRKILDMAKNQALWIA